MSLFSSFSRAVTRSMTSSMVRACSDGLGAAAAAMVPSPLDASTRMAVIDTLRIFSLPSVGQAQLNPHAGRKIDRLAVPLCRFKLNLLCCADGGLVESMAQSAHHMVDLHGTVRQEHHVDDHVAFQLQTAPFRGVLRTRLVQDVHRPTSGLRGSCFLLRNVRYRALVGKTRVLHRSALPARRRIRG